MGGGDKEEGKKKKDHWVGIEDRRGKVEGLLGGWRGKEEVSLGGRRGPGRRVNIDIEVEP